LRPFLLKFQWLNGLLTITYLIWGYLRMGSHIKRRMTRLILVSIALGALLLFFPNIGQAPQAVFNFMSNTILEEKLPRYVIHKINPQAEGIVVKPSGSYDSIKIKIASQREALRQKWDAASAAEREEVIAEAGNVFTESLLNEIIPHWYGTVWDYNGYTDVPGSGQVACGYFVSTTLKHIGVNLNRYKLAQAYSLKAVEVLQGSKATNVSGVGQDSFVTYMETKKDGFYALGLDSHIGFVLVRNGKSYFIHSSNVWPGIVCIESARETVQFRWNNSFVVADLSNNESFLKKWMKQEAFIVP